MGRRALAAVLVLSCGGQQGTGPGTPSLGPSTVKAYDPLGARRDAKQSNQAVILGTDEKNGSTVMPLPASQSKATVDAMWVKMGGKEPASGGSTPVKLVTAPNADGSVQVGIYEELSGGTGPQWRAGVWIAAFVAATTLNKDLTDYTFSASSGGYIDGASASGLMAAGFLSSMTGARVDAGVTMTGINNPDGTIGPVAGIPEKFLGSIEKGKKRLGFPIGMRYTRSEASGETIDLVELAKAHGAEAVEIADVHEAYHLLTNEKLPQPVPVPEADMALDAGTTAALEAKYKAWQDKLGVEWKTIIELEATGKLPPTLRKLKDSAKLDTDLAEKYHAKGQVAAAYGKMLSAYAYAYAAGRAHDIETKARTGDLDGAIAVIDALAAQEDVTKKVFDTVGALKPHTLGGHLQMLAAFQAALRAWGFEAFSKESIAGAKTYLETLKSTSKEDLGAPDAGEAILSTIAPALQLAARTRVEDELALQVLDFEKEDSVSYMCSIPNVKRLSTSYQSASAAAINYFDQLLLTPQAQAWGMTEDAARQRLAMVEPDYLVAYMTSHLPNWDGLPQDLKKSWGESSFAWNLMTLAGNELAYQSSAQLIAKYYSLSVETGLDGRAERVEHDKAFANMLASAERNARSNARGAKIAAGAVPIQARLAYQLAQVERDGDLGERIDALFQFWIASAYAQTAVALARN